MFLQFYCLLFITLSLDESVELHISDYYPIHDQNVWNYEAPENWKDGDYISSIEATEFDQFYKSDPTLTAQHQNYYGALWLENQAFLHYDATKAAKLLHINSSGIFYVGELFSNAESFVLFDTPIQWFAHESKLGDSIDEERNYTRYYKNGISDKGTFRISQTISKKERVEAVHTNFEDCIRVDFKTYWKLSDTQNATSINTYHYARHVGVVKAKARFIITNHGKEIINRLIETTIKSFQLNSNDYKGPTAIDIMREAHKHAGGEFWSKPKTLSLSGHGYFYKDGLTHFHEIHKMYRVFEDRKTDAHRANGKVRIESYRKGQPIIMVTFDGQNTYDSNGKRPQSDADKQWASNFGYGVIRHALDPEYQLERLPDDQVDDLPTYMINVIDPNGGETLFGISKVDYKIIKVAFNTPRGWHERIYSDFFTKEGINWQQSGRVRLFYNGIKSNEIIWTDFDVNKVLSDSLFKI